MISSCRRHRLGRSLARCGSRNRGTTSGRAGLDESFAHGSRVAQPTAELLGAAELLDERQPVSADGLLVVDVRHAAHQRTKDDFSVVLEKVDLRNKVVIKYNGAFWEVRS